MLINSDVLAFNGALGFLPGIGLLTRLVTRLGEWIVRLPGMERNGPVAGAMP
jgi:hypothetical protein